MDSTVLGICKECGSPYSYQFLGRSRWFCEPCVQEKARAASKRHRLVIKLKPGELCALSSSGIAAIAKMSQKEAAAKLAVWETLELMRTTGRTDVEVEPITAQAVQQIERSALVKLRRALAPYWKQYKLDMAEESRERAGIRVSASIMDRYYTVRTDGNIADSTREVTAAEAEIRRSA